MCGPHARLGERAHPAAAFSIGGIWRHRAAPDWQHTRGTPLRRSTLALLLRGLQELGGACHPGVRARVRDFREAGREQAQQPARRGVVSVAWDLPRAHARSAQDACGQAHVDSTLPCVANTTFTDLTKPSTSSREMHACMR